MKKLLILFVLIMPLLAQAQKSTYQEDLLGVLEFTRGQVTSLAKEMKGDAWEYSPAEGVRATNAVLMHIANANYFLGMNLGAELPEGLDLMTFEKSATSFDDVMSALDDSYNFASDAVNEYLTKKNMSDQVELPFGSFSKRAVTLIMLSHSADHKGTLVAYARMNGITPPWSK